MGNIMLFLRLASVAPFVIMDDSSVDDEGEGTTVTEVIHAEDISHSIVEQDAMTAAAPTIENESHSDVVMTKEVDQTSLFIAAESLDAIVEGGEEGTMPPALVPLQPESFFTCDLMHSLSSAHVVMSSALNQEDYLNLVDEIREILSTLISSLGRTTSADSFKRLLDRYQRRMDANGSNWGYLSCLPFILETLGIFCDEWLLLEDGAKPRTPIAQISAMEVELAAVQQTLACKLAQQQSAVSREAELHSTVAVLKNEKAAIEKHRHELWEAYQQLGEQLAFKECLIARYEGKLTEESETVQELHVVLDCVQEQKTILEEDLTALQTSKIADPQIVEALANLKNDFALLKDNLLPLLVNLRDTDWPL